MDKYDAERLNHRYIDICICKRCSERFLFTEALARKISFGLEDKICPKCGSSQITFVKFADNSIQSYTNKFKLPV